MPEDWDLGPLTISSWLSNVEIMPSIRPIARTVVSFALRLAVFDVFLFQIDNDAFAKSHRFFPILFPEMFTVAKEK
jgi:hypothetical protein